MLFRLERNPDFDPKSPSRTFARLWEWIEVLAIQPDKLVSSEEPHLAHVRRIECVYVCRTEEGLIRLDARSLWEAIEHDEYRLGTV